MGKKGNKKYIRVCENYHSQFEGYKLPVGAYYGRNGDTFFVVTYGNEYVRTYYKADLLIKGNATEGNADWHKGKVPVRSEIGKMISALIREKGNPVIGKYNRKIGVNNISRLEKISYQGKTYYAFPTEMSLPDDFGIDKEVRKSGDCPIMRGMMEPNLTGGRRQRPVETQSTEEHFIRDSVAVANENSFWAIYKDMERRCMWSDKYKAYV